MEFTSRLFLLDGSWARSTSTMLLHMPPYELICWLLNHKLLSIQNAEQTEQHTEAISHYKQLLLHMDKVNIALDRLDQVYWTKNVRDQIENVQFLKHW